ncbi:MULTISPECIES: carbohydrate ABC transporter permease [Cohnella]|jgi:multiple sugar transport system permease protein|uniref:carbohydrate ABC transporter permease n=1 Tax=Cohnella TaxID=329857 RepID=UPI000377FD92|nr:MULTISPECIES: carbohydrate ABC transporter permease [Cohnella]REK64330.1 MAG: carbohydrate ABC transporter permease [Cohnella sp.]
MSPKVSRLRPLVYVILGIYAIVTFVPFLWALSASFKPLHEIVSGGMHLIPRHFTLDNYKTILQQEPMFGRWFLNSAFIAVSVTVFNLLFNSLAGYALARIKFPGSTLMFYSILGMIMIPGQLTIIPSYLIIKELGWLNSYQAIIVPMAAQATYIFMMRQFFINFPKELEEAAELDGLGRFGTFFRVVLPLAKPALAAQTIFIFMGAWNEFLKPLMLMSDKAMFTLSVGLNTFKGQYISFWNYIMAASIIMTLPALLIYVFFNRFFVQGITFTGGK